MKQSLKHKNFIKKCGCKYEWIGIVYMVHPCEYHFQIDVQKRIKSSLLKGGE